MAIHTVITGRVDIETIINAKGKVSLAASGGSCLYAAAGFKLWKENAGLVGKIGEGVSRTLVNPFEARGFNCTGIKKTVEEFNQEKFYAFNSKTERLETENPKKHFFNLNKPFPKELLGYIPPSKEINSKKKPAAYSITPEDLPEEFLSAHNHLMCAADFVTHSLLPPFLRAQVNASVILCGSDEYMHPSFWFEIPALIRGCSAFLATAEQINKFFVGKNLDLWERLKFICDCGVPVACMVDANGAVHAYDSEQKQRIEIPSYPTEQIDPVGVFSVFCGGFAAGFFSGLDAYASAIMGNVSANIKLEGSTPLYVLNCLPELANRRKEFQESVAIFH